jgi:hypothetical protein
MNTYDQVMAGAKDCPTTRRELSDAVTAQLERVQGDIAERQRRMAAAGPGSSAWAKVTAASLPLFEDAARLQAVAAALASATHTGPCGDECGCATALAAPAATYGFPVGDVAGAPVLACDLAADGGDAADRTGVWQQVLARVQRRDALPDSAAGVALRFPLDADLAATLARLAAAEYRCCSFGSYTVVIDHHGLCLEVRMPEDAGDTLAAVLGVPDTDRDQVSARR